MKISLRLKWIIVVVSLILIISVPTCLISIRQCSATLREELYERGLTLAKGLARSSEYGLFTENKEILGNLVGSVAKASDVSYCAVYDKHRRLLVSYGDFRGELIESKGEDAEGYLDIVVLVTTATPVEKEVEGGLFAGEDKWIEEVKKAEEAAPDGELALFERKPKIVKKTIGFARVGISETRVLKNIAALRNKIVEVSFIATALGIITTIFFVNGMIAPIRKLSLAARSVAEGDLSKKVEISRDDELGALADSFNEMTEELAKAEEELKKYQEHLEDLVKDRTAELETANKELDSFASSVSHDLRAPLRSMDGFSHALLEDYGDKLDSTGKDYLEQVREASQHMGELIDDLLRLSRITRTEMRREKVDLSGIAKDVAAELSRTAPNRQIKFIIQPDLAAEGDARLLRIVLENLMGNACKFTSKKTNARIEFGIVEKDGKTAYFVRDNGAGFNMAYADKLFKSFQRLHSPAEFPGTGVGLATVHRIVHRHGGRVWGESEEGKGAAFYFCLE